LALTRLRETMMKFQKYQNVAMIKVGDQWQNNKGANDEEVFVMNEWMLITWRVDGTVIDGNALNSTK